MKTRHTWLCGTALAALLLANLSLLDAQNRRPAAPAPSPQNPADLGIPGTARTAPLKLEAFTDLPAARPHTQNPAGANVIAGTPGLDLGPLPAPRNQPITVAILGALAPADRQTPRNLQAAIEQLNLLRPDLVLTTGNLIPGLTRDGQTYAKEALALQDSLAALKMPWLPCAGETDLASGTRDPADLRFDALYQQYIGPRYYAATAGDLEIIALDSEHAGDGAGGINDQQFQWLKSVLGRAFEGNAAGRARFVIVVVHRPLWRTVDAAGKNTGKNGGWQRVHDLLADFNHRPTVTVEGMGGEDRPAGPRVVAVIAGSERAYALDPIRDGIRYYVLGPTAAVPHAGEDTRETLRQILVIKLDPGPTAPGVHASLIAIGEPSLLSGQPAFTLPEDIITQSERQVIDRIAGWNGDSEAIAGESPVISIDGSMDLPEPIAAPQPGTTEPATHSEASIPAPLPAAPRKIMLHITNPLADPIDIQLHLASAQFLSSAPRRELANAGAEGLDLPWELNASHVIRHIAAGGKDTINFTLERPDSDQPIVNAQPAELEIEVHWNDPRGRSHRVVLKRRITLVPAVKIPAAREPVHMDDDRGWEQAVQGAAYAWTLRGDEPQSLNPLWSMTADAQYLYVRVRADDDTPSYWPQMALDPTRGGIASDAVCITWADVPAGAAAPHIQRIWVLPHAPPIDTVWTNTGPQNKQSDLLHLRPDTGIHATVDRRAGGYTVTLCLPRPLLHPPGAAETLMNISVMDNQNGPRSWSRSWANPDAPPAEWGHVQFTER